MGIVIVAIISAVLALFLYYANSIWNLFRTYEHAKKIPGPEIHPIFGNVPSLINSTTADLGGIFKNWAKNQREKGDQIMRMVLFGNMYVWPLNGKTVAKILDSTTELNKGDDYSFFIPWVGNGLLLENGGDRWRSHRKMLTPTFHFAKLEGYFEVFNTECQILIEQIEKFAESGESFNIFPYVKRCLLDIICETAMGIKIDAQNNHEHKYIQACEKYMRMAVIHWFTPWVRHPLLFKLLGYQKQTEDYLTTMKGFTEKVIRERRAAHASGEIEINTSKRMMNFLDLLLSQEDSNNLSEEDIRQEVDTFMFAGHDTTTSASSFALWNIAHNSDVQQKIYEELVEVFGEDPRTDVTLENISKLGYLDKVLKESKRIIAPVPAVQRKLKNELEIDGYIIPRGSNITIAPIVLHNNADVFPNPDVFDPERFSPEEISKRHPYDFIPFSAGLRNCIGQKFAQLNEKVLICHILRNFEIEPTLKWNETIPCVEVVTKPSKGIPLKLKRR
ncbi:unnamed protein product [Caenorhabditis angaria]|uniref:CYtochrome P450 family n=1 Tax=Caenorhabditis angaria TaxID=860376 RepID=A0A9P1IT51_9PELO|nr:unnamed protein product [Caenorhabditis angaria]